MNVKKKKDTHLNVRIQEDIKFIMEKTLEVSGLSKKDFVTLAILDSLSKIETGKYFYHDIDLIEYAKISRARKLRELHGLKRTEILSKATFIQRVERDIFLMLKSLSPLTEVKKLLLVRKIEAVTYKDNEEIIRLINEYLEISEDNYKTITDKIARKYRGMEILDINPNATIDLLELKK